MPSYKLENLRRHWVVQSTEFERAYPETVELFEAISELGSRFSEELSVPKSLSSNSAYLLLSKSLNHAFASLLLLERGLIVDAALSSRNALESLLLLELLAKDPHLCSKWANGKRIGPAEVRQRLSRLLSVTVGELVINVSEDEYSTAREAYKWLCEMTHANIASFHHVATQTGESEWSLAIGGAHSEKAVVAVAAVVGSAFSRALVTTAAAYLPEFLQEDTASFESLDAKLALVLKKEAANFG